MYISFCSRKVFTHFKGTTSRRKPTLTMGNNLIICEKPTPVIASHISSSQLLNVCKLDGERQATLFNIRSEGKLKSGAE